MARRQVRWVIIQCPKCGEATRAEVVAAAFLGGWCIGMTRAKKHKPVDYKVIGETVH